MSKISTEIVPFKIERPKSKPSPFALYNAQKQAEIIEESRRELAFHMVQDVSTVWQERGIEAVRSLRDRDLARLAVALTQQLTGAQPLDPKDRPTIDIKINTTQREDIKVVPHDA